MMILQFFLLVLNNSNNAFVLLPQIIINININNSALVQHLEENV